MKTKPIVIEDTFQALDIDLPARNKMKNIQILDERSTFIASLEQLLEWYLQDMHRFVENKFYTVIIGSFNKLYEQLLTPKINAAQVQNDLLTLKKACIINLENQQNNFGINLTSFFEDWINTKDDRPSFIDKITEHKEKFREISKKMSNAIPLSEKGEYFYQQEITTLFLTAILYPIANQEVWTNSFCSCLKLAIKCLEIDASDCELVADTDLSEEDRLIWEFIRRFMFKIKLLIFCKEHYLATESGVYTLINGSYSIIKSIKKQNPNQNILHIIASLANVPLSDLININIPTEADEFYLFISAIEDLYTKNILTKENIELLCKNPKHIDEISSLLDQLYFSKIFIQKNIDVAFLHPKHAMNLSRILVNFRSNYIPAQTNFDIVCNNLENAGQIAKMIITLYKNGLYHENNKREICKLIKNIKQFDVVLEKMSNSRILNQTNFDNLCKKNSAWVSAAILKIPYNKKITQSNFDVICSCFIGENSKPPMLDGNKATFSQPKGDNQKTVEITYHMGACSNAYLHNKY